MALDGTVKLLPVAQREGTTYHATFVDSHHNAAMATLITLTQG
jgi:hypothetical protein